MELQIKNKNNNAWYKIRQGMVVTRNYNETLNSAVTFIDQLTAKIDIEPLDEVVIKIDNTTFEYMCVDNFVCSQIAFGDPILYQYQINLVSQTKLLEGVILPSLKITQLKGATKRKVVGDGVDWGYLDEYLGLYAQQIRRKTGTATSKFKLKWMFSSDIDTKFSNVECPEKQWNQPTLREVLNDLMMTKDCIATLKNGEIGYIDLSQVGNEISTTGLIQVENSQSSSEYVSELRCEMKNAIAQNVSGITNDVLMCEDIGFRADKEVLSSNNFRLETQNNIADIVSIKVSGIVSYVQTGGLSKYVAFDNYDITPYIVEQKEWETKEIYYNATGNPNPSDLGQYQQTTLFYTRYGNIIDGFSALTSYRTLFTTNSQNCLAVLLTKIARDISGDSGAYVNYNVAADSKKYLMFNVKYKTSSSALLQAGKTTSARNDRVVIDNQDNSYIDPYSQGILEYMKANRLGNLMTLIEARYSYTDTLPQLGQTYNGAVIFKTETSYYDDYILMNMWATPEYVLKDYWTGVQAKLRSWKIVDGNDALERHDLRKVYFEFDYKKSTEILPSLAGSLAVSYNLENYMLNQFTSTTNAPLKSCGVRFTDENGTTYPSGVYYYLCDLSARLAGNSLLFTFGFNDNFKVGNYIDLTKSLGTEIIGGLAQYPMRYVDGNGENASFQMILTNCFKSIEAEKYNQTFPLGDAMIPYLEGQYSRKQATRPKAQNTEFTFDSSIPTAEQKSFTMTFEQHKDNAEITRFTLQFEFCSASDDLVFGTQFLKNLQAIRTVTHNNSWKFYKSYTKPTFRDRDRLPSDYAPIYATTPTITVNNNCLVISNRGDFTTYDYIYITDGNDNVILAYKINHEATTDYIYLNLLQIRDKNIYDDNGYITGDITSIVYGQEGTDNIPATTDMVAGTGYFFNGDVLSANLRGDTFEPTGTISVVYTEYVSGKGWKCLQQYTCDKIYVDNAVTYDSVIILRNNGSADETTLNLDSTHAVFFKFTGTMNLISGETDLQDTVSNVIIYPQP